MTVRGWQNMGDLYGVWRCGLNVRTEIFGCESGFRSKSDNNYLSITGGEINFKSQLKAKSILFLNPF